MGQRSAIPVLARAISAWRWLIGLALIVRLSYWAIVRPGWHPKADADQYVRLGRSLANGDGFSLVFPQTDLHATAFRPPLYPLLLAPGNLVFGEALWPARLLNVLLGVLVVVLAAVLAARIGGRLAGIVAGASVAIYPPLLANDTVTLTEPLALALLLGCILLVDDSRWALAGVALGGLLLTRPNGYLVVMIIAGWAGLRLGAKRGFAVAAVAGLVLAPWLVRNAIQVDTWRPTTSDGFTLAAMWAPRAQEAGNFVDPVFAEAYDHPEDRLAQFDEAGWNQKLTDEALDGMRDNPDYLRELIARNARGFFEIEPRLNRYPERNDGRKWSFRQATLPAFYLVTVLGLVGLATTWRDDRIRVFVLLVAQFVGLSLVLVAPPRLRAPFDLLMCIGVGLLAAWAAGKIRTRRSTRSTAAPGDPAPVSA